MSELAYRASLAAALGIGSGCFDRPGTTVCPAEARRASAVVSHYRIGERSILWCDPALADRLVGFDDAGEPIGHDAFGEWAIADGAELVGAGFEHVLRAGWSAPAAAAERLDADDTSHVGRVAELLDACGDDDRDEAEFDVNALDPFLVGWSNGGRLVAIAGARPWDQRPGLHDIGVLVRPDSRGHGLGAHVVAALTADVIAAGETPLYRCNQDNLASWRLCRSVGYELVVELTAHRWPVA